MFKRQTTRSRRSSHSKVLEVRVMSPRIAWLGALRVAGSLTKLACILAVIAGIGWGGGQGIQHAFYNNPDFRLQVIDLNANPVIDEVELVKAAEIYQNPNLFKIDVKEVERKLKCLPEIAEVHAERHLPGTLMVRVTARTPWAWISCPAAGLPEVRRPGAMLVDRDGIAYPCPVLQLESAVRLPSIQLPASKENPIIAGKRVNHPELVHCFQLLDSACEADAEAIHWIDSVKQTNEWSMLLTTRQGIAATFGLGDHARQIGYLRAAIDHASQKGYAIETINLIPKRNVPITVHGDARATPPLIAETRPTETREKRRTR
ncbi:MAG: FtsQ-type POTRA domain-containing protein [Verrucomicrobiota bacterium]